MPSVSSPVHLSYPLSCLVAVWRWFGIDMPSVSSPVHLSYPVSCLVAVWRWFDIDMPSVSSPVHLSYPVSCLVAVWRWFDIDMPSVSSPVHLSYPLSCLVAVWRWFDIDSVSNVLSGSCVTLIWHALHLVSPAWQLPLCSHHLLHHSVALIGLRCGVEAGEVMEIYHCWVCLGYWSSHHFDCLHSWELIACIDGFIGLSATVEGYQLLMSHRQPLVYMAADNFCTKIMFWIIININVWLCTISNVHSIKLWIYFSMHMFLKLIGFHFCYTD